MGKRKGMLQVVREGCGLSYRVDGDSHADAVLFSNSLGTTHELWKPQLDAMSLLFRIIRYDTRGHGASDAPAGAYTLDQLGLDALAILDAAGARRAHICGLSLGGLTAMWLGVHAPDRVASLVLASTGARIGNALLWQERIEQVKISGVGALAEAAMGRWFTHAFREAHPDIVARFYQMLATSPAEGYASCCAAIRDADLRAEIGTIAAPTLVIAGTHDPVTPPADAEAIRARVRGARVSLLDAAHITNVEQADAFNECAITFITKQGRMHG
jgi:3-oxoadipate enol-lactonase